MDGQARASMRIAAVARLFCALVLLCGCQVLALNGSNLPAPTTTREFIFDPQRDDVVGEPQVIRAIAADTFPDIARRFNLGFEELVAANPGLDPWLPGDGTEVLLMENALSAALASLAVRLQVRSKIHIDQALLADTLQLRGAIALPLTTSDLDLPGYLAEVTRVRNPEALSEPSETGDERVSLTDAAVAGGAADRP